jgi:DNA-binding LytR/AlgR family response regulator
MIKIAICDDEKDMQDELLAYTRRLMGDKSNLLKVYTFKSGEEILAQYPKNLKVLLLDIEMAGIDGLETAKRVRVFDSNVKIVFITKFPNFALSGYKVRAFGYLVKPLSFDDFALELRELLQRVVEAQNTMLNIKNHQSITRLAINGISFIETQGHKMLIHTQKGDYETTSTMRALEKRLALYRFVRCHTAFLVNSDKIVKISGNRVVLSTGQELPISKHRRQKFMQSLCRYWDVEP